MKQKQVITNSFPKHIHNAIRGPVGVPSPMSQGFHNEGGFVFATLPNNNALRLKFSHPMPVPEQALLSNSAAP